MSINFFKILAFRLTF